MARGTSQDGRSSGASIGANATILPGLEIGRGAMVGAGAVVTRSVPAHAQVVMGNPARIKGYVQTQGHEGSGDHSDRDSSPGKTEAAVRGVHVRRFAEFSDLRGRLTAGETRSRACRSRRGRWFLGHDVPSREVRGEHAHRACHQFLLCVAGRGDGRRRRWSSAAPRCCSTIRRSVSISPRSCGAASFATTPTPGPAGAGLPSLRLG